MGGKILFSGKRLRRHQIPIRFHQTVLLAAAEDDSSLSRKRKLHWDDY
jgi:hypothetical protein